MRKCWPLLFILIFFVLINTINLVDSANQSWNSGMWLYKQNIIIKNNVATTLTDFQVNVTIDTAVLISAGKMQSNCNDIRFVNSTSSQINYWIKTGTCNTTSTEIWVKVPRIPASGTEDITMYYGNPSAAAGSNGTATFIFFDDFEGPCTFITPSCFVKYAGNPVLANTSSNDLNFSYDARGMREVFIMQVINETTYEKTYQENGTYRMFYNSCGNNSGDQWFTSMATSTDKYNWTRTQSLITKNFTYKSWDSVTRQASIVYKYNGTYYLYHVSSNTTTGNDEWSSNCPVEPYRTGLATTTNVSNMSSWVTQNSGNPILDIVPGTPYSNWVAASELLRDPSNSSQWLMFAASGDGALQRILRFKSVDLVNWTYVGLITGQHDTTGEENPKIIKADDGNYYMTSNHIEGDHTDSVYLYRNVSTDLSSWTYLGTVIGASGSSWDAVTIGMPGMLYENSILWIYYDGGPTTGHGHRQIGISKNGGVGTDKNWTAGPGGQSGSGGPGVWSVETKDGSSRMSLLDGLDPSMDTLYTNIGITSNYTIEGNLIRDSEASNYYSGFLFRHSDQQNFYATFSAYYENVLSITRMLSGTWGGCGISTAKTITPNVYYNLSLSVYTNSSGGTSFNFIVDGTNRSGSDNQLTTATNVGLWAHAGDYGEISSTWWDDFRVRKYALIEPTVTIDTQPPVVLSSSPANGAELDSGTTLVTIILTTDETALCRYNIIDTDFANMVQMNSTNSTTHNMTITRLSDGNRYDYYFRCQDVYNNNTATTSYHLTFSVKSLQTAAINPDDEGSNNIKHSERDDGKNLYFSKMFALITSAGITFSVDKPATGVSELFLSTNKDVTNIRISLMETGTIYGITPPPGEIYKYLKITADNLKNTDIKESKIKFNVNKTWADAYDDIALYRYDNDWKKLPTSKLNEGTDFIYYSSTIPGFSYFAITGMKGAPTSINERGIESEGELLTGAAVEVSKMPSIFNLGVLFFALVGILLIYTGIIYYKKFRRN